MNKEFNQEEQKIIDLLKKTKQFFLLTPEEKSELKVKLMKNVTKAPNMRYKIWLYKLNIRGVVMPIIPIILAVLVAGGVGTAALADTAKPGDLLYPIDQFVERVQEKMPMSQGNRAIFWGKLSSERSEELLRLREIDPSTLTEGAKARWEQHQENAVERLAAHIERTDAIKAKFQEKIEATDNEAEITAFQRVITNLESAEARRTENIERIEKGELPEIGSMPVMEKMQLWKEVSSEEREMIHNAVGKEFMMRAPVRRTGGNEGLSSLLEVDSKTKIDAESTDIETAN